MLFTLKVEGFLQGNLKPKIAEVVQYAENTQKQHYILADF